MKLPKSWRLIGAVTSNRSFLQHYFNLRVAKESDQRPSTPSSNGMIERCYRCLETAIMFQANPNMSRSLSRILLGLRSHVMDIGSSPAGFLYGTTLRIPGEFVLPDDFTPTPQLFLEEFREHIRSIKPVPVGHNYKKQSFLYKDLSSCSHVFLRVGTSKRSLKRPYFGPHKVINRTTDRFF